MQRQTTIAKSSEIVRKWYVVDATDKPLGRLASEIAKILMGKNKPIYTPNVDCGDYVIVINCEKVALNGNNKLTNKKYYNVSLFPGGLRTRTAEEMIAKYPEEMMERSVWGMLPKGKLGRQIAKKLFAVKGSEHKYAAQKPEALEIKF